MAFKMAGWSGYQKDPSAFVKDDKFVQNNPNAVDPQNSGDNNPANINKNVKSNKPLEATYDTKTRKGLFGRTVTKYFDKETGKKVGKKVQRTKRDGTEVTKTKAVQKGKLRKQKVADNYFDEKRNKKTGNQTMTSHERVTTAQNKPELQEFVKTDKKGNNPRLEKYSVAWNDGRFKVDSDAKTRTDKFGNVYSDDEKGYGDFVTASEAYWEKQKANKSSMKKSALKNYKKGYYGVK